MEDRYNDANRQAIGKRVEQLRRRIGLSRERLADQSGVSSSLIKFIEKGTRELTLNEPGSATLAPVGSRCSYRADFMAVVCGWLSVRFRLPSGIGGPGMGNLAQQSGTAQRGRHPASATSH